MSDKKKTKIHCKDVGCELRGFWVETAPDGEKLIKTTAMHEGERHIATLKLAEMAVKMIRQDPRFAEHFKKLFK